MIRLSITAAAFEAISATLDRLRAHTQRASDARWHPERL